MRHVHKKKDFKTFPTKDSSLINKLELLMIQSKSFKRNYFLRLMIKHLFRTGEFLIDSPARLMTDIGHMVSARVEEVDILNGFTNREGALLLILLKLNPVKDVYTARHFHHLLSTWMTCADLGPANGVAFKVLYLSLGQFFDSQCVCELEYDRKTN